MAQNQTQTEVIDGIRYTVRMLPARKGYKLALRMAKAAGPAIAMFVDKAVSGGADAVLNESISEGTFSTAVATLVDRLDESTVDDVIQQMSECTEADGQLLHRIFDLHFMGAYDRMVKWLAFALKVNFGNFTAALGDALSQGQAAAAPGK